MSNVENGRYLSTCKYSHCAVAMNVRVFYCHVQFTENLLPRCTAHGREFQGMCHATSVFYAYYFHFTFSDVCLFSEDSSFFGECLFDFVILETFVDAICSLSTDLILEFVLELETELGDERVVVDDASKGRGRCFASSFFHFIRRF